VLKATVQRRYKDKSGSWKSTTSFSRNEIPLAIYVTVRGSPPTDFGAGVDAGEAIC
jgi:hypothetical protein